MLRTMLESPTVRRVFAVHAGGFKTPDSRCESIEAPSPGEGRLWNRLIRQARTPYLLLVGNHDEIEWGPGAPARLMDIAETTKAGMVYADYCKLQDGRRLDHPLNDYQYGSIRDDFHFGPVRLISVAAARYALRHYGPLPELLHAGLYDLRLKISTDSELFHAQECLYTVKPAPESQKASPRDGNRPKERPRGEETLFAYVDPRNEHRQREMETVATAHLKRIGAWLKPVFKDLPASRSRYPVEASIIIPVRNRRQTLSDALKSALSQQTDFAFNVICVDNHSTDGTTALLARWARKYPALTHLVPVRTDLGIGGCWNEAIFHQNCGRYAVQLDSDDLYVSPFTLQQIVDRLRSGLYAAVIGSYTIVNEKGEVIPPGHIDHREWTDDNGRNNALRINGLGAPRAFRTDLLRRIGFLNVSYGEDYAVMLRLLREYRLGRIYESLYLCRRWEGNTDAGLTLEKTNRNDAFKDKIRTLEIRARQALNRE